MLGFGPVRVVRRDEPGVPITAEVDLPITVMDQGVVHPAQQHPAIQTGGTAFAPRDDVVGIAPRHRPPTAGERTPTIPNPQRFADTRREQAFTAPDIDWDAGVVDDDSGQGAVTRDQVCGGSADRAGEPQRVHRTFVHRSDQGDMRQYPTGHGSIRVRQIGENDLAHRIGTAPPGRSRVR